ncbi:13004_t:CDS:2, partial [Entrophospora sp. SA101]
MLKLPFEIILLILEQLPTRQLCKFATLSKTYNLEIKRIVYLSRYDLLEMSQTNHVYDLAFKNVNQEKLFALFSMETTQPKGTIGPERHNLEEHLNITCCPFIPESTINEALQLCPKLKHFELGFKLNTNIYIENYKEPYKWSNSESTSSDSDD